MELQALPRWARKLKNHEVGDLLYLLPILNEKPGEPKHVLKANGQKERQNLAAISKDSLGPYRDEHEEDGFAVSGFRS